METYALDGKEASVCPDCGFVDTPVEHDDIDRRPSESWSDALERFKRKHGKRNAE